MKATRDTLLEDFVNSLLRRVGALDLVGAVSVYWNPLLRTTAGMANFRKKAIYLNPQLVTISAGEVQRTLRHELAHFLAQHRAGRKRIQAHGVEWKMACRDLGIPNESACHNLPFKRRQVQRKHFYQCPQCATILARVRPLRRKVACLKCCRKHNAGQYSEAFRFLPVDEPANKMAAAA